MKTFMRLFLCGLLFSSLVEAKTLIIGDSMSSAGGRLSSGLASWQSERTRDAACVLSVSGSKFSDWTSGNSSLMASNRYGSSKGVYRYDLKQERSVGKVEYVNGKNLNWSLAQVLAKPQEFCVDERPFDDLIVQLGTNESANNFSLARYEEMLKISNGKIKRVHFILAPKNLNQDYTKFNQAAVKGIAELAKKYPKIIVSTFDSLSVPMQRSDFRKDGDHIWNSPGELQWLSGIKNHLSGGISSEEVPAGHKNTP